MTKNQLTPLDVELEQSADLLAQMPDGMIGRYGSTVGIRYLEGLLRRAAEEVRADEPREATLDELAAKVEEAGGVQTLVYRDTFGSVPECSRCHVEHWPPCPQPEKSEGGT